MKPGSAEWFDTTAAGRPKILVLGRYFPPAKRAGGPTRSVFEMVRNLPQYAFYVYCRDREFGTREKLPGIISNTWEKQGHAHVCYASFFNRTALHVICLLKKIRPDAIYICSFFAREPTMQFLCLRRLGLIGGIPVILAPHGEFSPGALSIKPRRKRLYLTIARFLRLNNELVWHACSSEELGSIRHILGNKAQVVEAPNFPPNPLQEALSSHRHKNDGMVHLLFLSRISPMKNLLGAIRILSRVKTPALLDIYGPIEDARYWRTCLAEMATLPAMVTARYKGLVDPELVGEVFLQYDALFLPTFGENYGYVIVESLAAATPVLLSDRTPWGDLESSHAGWIVDGNKPDLFVSRIEQLASMSEAEHARWRAGAFAYAQSLGQREFLHKAYANLFPVILK